MIPVTLIAVLTLGAETQPSFVYIESFRKGATRVTEQTLEVELNPQNPTCEIRVKDQNGRDRYSFGCVPQRVGPGDDRIIAWQVRLADKQHKIYPNLLLSTPDPTQEHSRWRGGRTGRPWPYWQLPP